MPCSQPEEGIWTAQRLYGQALSDLMGYLVTHLTWDDGTPVVLEQYFDWARPERRRGPALKKAF